jgi:hypothetical protein
MRLMTWHTLSISPYNEGIAHSFFQGRVLEESDMHSRADVGEAAARLVAGFHALPVGRCRSTLG